MIFMSYAAALALSRESCAAATFITSYDCVPGAWEGCTVKFDSTLPSVPCTAGNPCAAPAPVPANPMPAPPISLGSPIRSGTLTGANVFYLQACSDARFEITFAADPTGTRGPIQGYYGPMFEGETAGGGTVISVSNEQAVVATELGTIRCDGADRGTPILRITDGCRRVSMRVDRHTDMSMSKCVEGCQSTIDTMSIL